jgi:hypothetical protein
MSILVEDANRIIAEAAENVTPTYCASKPEAVDKTSGRVISEM